MCTISIFEVVSLWGKSIIFMWFDLFSNNFYSGIFIVFFVYWNGFEFIHFNILKHLFCGKMIDNNLLLYFMVYYLVFVFDRNMKSSWPYSLKKSKLFPSFIFYFDDTFYLCFINLSVLLTLCKKPKFMTFLSLKYYENILGAHIFSLQYKYFQTFYVFLEYIFLQLKKL